MGARAWTPEEDAALRRYYWTRPTRWPGWDEVLPGRTVARDVELEPDQARAFLDALDACRLIVHDLYAERQTVAIERVARNARESAEYIAKRRMAGIMSGQARAKKGR